MYILQSAPKLASVATHKYALTVRTPALFDILVVVVVALVFFDSLLCDVRSYKIGHRPLHRGTAKCLPILQRVRHD